MRNAKRIDWFVEDFRKIWKRVPDMRFGQLVMYMLEIYKRERGTDFFYTEDEYLFKFFLKYFNEEGSTHDDVHF